MSQLESNGRFVVCGDLSEALGWALGTSVRRVKSKQKGVRPALLDFLGLRSIGYYAKRGRFGVGPLRSIHCMTYLFGLRSRIRVLLVLSFYRNLFWLKEGPIRP